MWSSGAGLASRFQSRRPRNIAFERAAFAAIALAISACGEGSGPSPTEPGGGGGNRPGVAPPKFRYEEGPPGRAVGVRAIVEVDGIELTADPVELTLTPPPSES